MTRSRLGLAVLIGSLASCERASTTPEQRPEPATDQQRQTPGPSSPSAARDAEPPQGLPPSALALVRPERLRAHVERLAHDRMRGRATPSPQLDAAADYIREQWRAQGLIAVPTAPDYEQRFECGGPGRPGLASNVIALLPGHDPAAADQTVMVTAHYDHLGEGGAGPDRIFNGANDNASGTAALLLVSEVLATAPPRRSVLFVAFCGEEQGLRGSEHYAAHPVRPLDEVVAHVNLEMLGRPGAADPPVAWIPGGARSELIDWLVAATPASEVRFVDGNTIGPEEGAAFDRSDNYPLAQRGVVAHTVASGPLDGLYHSPDDEADRLDYERMAMVVRAIVRGVHRLAEHPGRPAWIDPPR